MRYGSICSGIEAASVAWEPLGWTPAWFSEINPFCCSLLKQRYPSVPNLGDITNVTTFPSVHIIIGGTPCQSFSINNPSRCGVDDDRGKLAVRYFEIVGDLHPRWLVWENVPGVLSANQGRDFGTFLGMLAKLGYGWSYRVLDSSFFGSPQRRRRVFLVGHLGDAIPAAGVLFDASACGESPRSSRKIQAASRQRVRQSSEAARIGWTGDETPKHAIDGVPTLRSGQGGEGACIIDQDQNRRLTVTEWERLQGFPDGYTEVTHNDKPAGEQQRRFALGNSFCTHVVRWIGVRIQAMEQILCHG